MIYRTNLRLGVFAGAVALLCSIASSPAFALGLGRITVQSALGEILKAEIDVPEITPEEAATLRLGIAVPSAFRAAGLEYSPMLAGFQVTLQKRVNGRSYIALSSSRPVTEPFVDLILEASWASGRLVRDYTMLFDPPSLRQAAPGLVIPTAPAVPRTSALPAPATPPMAGSAAVTPSAIPSRVSPRPAGPTVIQPASRSGTAAVMPAAAGQKIEVRAGDTAGKIAAQNKPTSVSLDQMLVALLRGNPQAFISGNINRLKAGAVLNIPAESDVASVSSSEASQTIFAQSKDFNNFRQKLAGGIPTTQVESANRQVGGKVQAKVDDKAVTAVAPDKLTLSKGALQDKAAAEEKIAKDKQLKEASTRVAELSKNIGDLNKIAGVAPAPVAASVATGVGTPILKPAAMPAAATATPTAAFTATPTSVASIVTTTVSASALAASAAKPAAPLAVTVPVATAATGATATATAIATATGVVATSTAAAVATPQPVVLPATAAAIATPQPVVLPATPASDAAIAATATAAASGPAAINKPEAVVPPASEPGLIEGLTDNPLVLPGLAALLALLAAFGFYRYKKRENQAAVDSSFLESRLQPDSFFGASGGQRIDTSEGGSQTGGSSLVYSASQLDAAGDVDPVAEADVYLAYGRDLQAEEILKEALRTTPSRVAIHAKLMEIYAKRRDLKAFESLASVAFNLTQGNGPEWAYITEMGRDLNPGNPIYLPGGQPQGLVKAVPAFTPAIAAFKGADTIPQMVVSSKQAADSAVDFDLDLDFSEGNTQSIAAPAAHQNLQQKPAMSASELTESIQLRPDPDFAALDMDFGVGKVVTNATPKTFPPTNNDLSFNAASVALASAKPALLPPVPTLDTGMLEFDMSALSLDLDPPAAQKSSVSTASLSAELPVSDGPLDTKFALAEEFRALGDMDGARSLANEVVAQAQGALRVKAQAFLNNLS